MKPTLTLIVSLLSSAPLEAGVLPPDAVVEGKTIGEWSAEWWKWVFSIPTNQNPQLDCDGRWAHLGQPEGDVFFLGGHSGLTPEAKTRSFSVPEGKFLLVPLLVAQIDNVDVVPPLPIPEMIDLIVDFVDAPRDLHATLDGMDVPNLVEHRALSPVFNFDLTIPDNFKSFNQGHPITGLVDPVISDGYWLMLQPLPLGTHTIRYGGAFRLPFFFTNDVIANITVVRLSPAQRVVELIGLVESAGVSPHRRQTLLASLNAAAASFEAGHLRAGVNQLRAFQRKLRAQVAANDAALAERLFESAQQIIDRASNQQETL